MATSPAPDAAAPPGMCPGIAVLGGGGGSGGADGDGSGDGDGAGGDGKGKGKGASGDGKNGGKGCGDPVCPITGRVFLDIYDFGFAGPTPLRWVRSYSSRTSRRAGELGHGWSHPYGLRVIERRRTVVVIDEAAREQEFERPSGDGESITNDLGLRLTREGQGYRLRAADGIEHVFGQRVGRELFLVAVVDTNGNAIRLARGERGELRGITDSAGRAYRVETDKEGRVTRVDVALDAAGSSSMMVARYEYDQAGDLALFVDAEGYEFRYIYENHLLVEHQTPGGLSYYYRYDGRDADAYCVETWGHYRSGPDPALDVQPPPRPAGPRDERAYKGNNHLRFTYDKAGFYTEVADALGGVTRYFGDARGRVLKEVDAAGGVTERAYDPESGALVSESLPDGTVRRMPREGRAARGFQDTKGTGAAVFIDDEGCEVTFDAETGFVLRARTDARGNVEFVEHSDGSIESYASDERGLLLSSSSRIGASARYEHDAMGNCVLAERQGIGVERSEHDYLGRRVAHVDAFGRRTEWAYDRRSSVVRKRHFDGSEVTIERDWLRRPVRVEDRGRVYRFAYGGIGWVYRYEAPGGRVTEYRYDAQGHLVRVRNPRGEEHRQFFDHAGRAVACETFEGARHEARYDAASRCTRVISPGGEEQRSYSDAELLAGAERSDGEVVTIERDRARRTLACTNADIRIETEFDPMGQVVRDRQGRHETRVLWIGGTLAAMASDVGVPLSFRRRQGGQVDEIRAGGLRVGFMAQPAPDTLVSTLGDELALVRRYGKSGELLAATLVRLDASRAPSPREIAAVRPHEAAYHVDYSYDDRLSLVSEQSADGRASSYDVDAAGQVRERRAFVRERLVATEKLAYDAAGTPLMPGVSYDARTRPTAYAGERFEYDRAGRLSKRMTDRGEFTYEYSAAGDLIRVVAPDRDVKLTYDVKGRRMRKCVYRQRELVSDTHYVWSNNVVLHEVDALSGATRTYLREEGSWEPFAHVDVASGVARPTFYVPHPSGCVKAAVDAEGQLVWEADMSVFGEAEPTRAAVDISARYPNQFYDADVELVYNYRRWYDPRVGLFISPDPWLLDGNANPRDYVPNPLVHIDPIGLFGPGMAHPGPPTQQDGQPGGDGRFQRNPTPPNGHAPRPDRPDPNNLGNRMDNYMLRPGAYATEGSHNSVGQWVPGYANCPPGWDPLKQSGWPADLQQQVDNAGYTHGCHSCGTTTPGGKGHFVPDHQPPVSQQKAAAAAGNPIPASQVRFYPHCQNCAGNQANAQNRLASQGQAANAAAAQTQAQQNRDFQNARNTQNQTAAELNAISDHMFGAGNYPQTKKAPVPAPVNPGDNRWLGGQSYSNWR